MFWRQVRVRLSEKFIKNIRKLFRYVSIWFILIVLASACLKLERSAVVPTVWVSVSPTPMAQTSFEVPATASEIPTNTPSPYGWTDENAVMSGICFEAALDASGAAWILRSAEEHIRFYALADNSRLCRHPVQRHSFDFTEGRVLAGIWSAGMGCKARHDVLEVRQDDAAQTLTIRLDFVTEGDCNYELVRPFWIGLDDVTDYTIQLEVE